MATMEQICAATIDLMKWLANSERLGYAPEKMCHVGCCEIDDLTYCLFVFRSDRKEPWLFGVCGGFRPSDNHPRCFAWSDLKPFDESTAQAEAYRMISEHIKRPALNQES